ncbi:MAG: glycosidase ph1107-related protein [Parcubacteria bacterium C7867-007]|nr:MAG: glycosidase ph1107-related protein [Parcubacteria bacterium C7867-007]
MFIVNRSPNNPIIVPSRANAFEAIGAFNPSVVHKDGVTHLFYRAMAEPDVVRTPHHGFSTIGHAAGCGDVDFEERTQVIEATEEWEHYGCEDPRATFFEGKWYVFYTALGGYPFGPGNIKAAVAIGERPDALTEKHLVTPFNAKAATLFPERIDGDAVLLVTAHTDWTQEHPRPTIGIARSKNIEDFWNPSFWKEWHANLSDHALPDVRRADTEHMEVAATPIRIPQGWLLVYSHIQDYYDEHRRIFGVEALLLDANDPRKIIGKTAYPFMVPEESYERYGIVANIVFPSGASVHADTLHVYYGAADTSCATATLSLSSLLESMDADKRKNFGTRAEGNPILVPVPEHSWESRAVFNAAAIDHSGSIHLLYRAMGADSTSTMGYARLEDGIHVTERLNEPAYSPRESFEAKGGAPDGNSGCEDPRLTLLDETLTVCYTAYDGQISVRGALSTIPIQDFVDKKFNNWSTPKLITPAGVPDKDVCIFPERVEGKVIVMHRLDPNICIAKFDSLEDIDVIDSAFDIMGPRRGMWDGHKVGAGAAPIRVPEGWLFIYHGIAPDKKTYRLGAALLDESGERVLSRMVAPILEPLEDWEKHGQIGDVVFTCGIAQRDDTLFVYYGGADSKLGVATFSVSDLMKRLTAT